MSQPTDIADLAAEADRFGRRLQAIKRARQLPEYGWYPYDTFGVFPVLASMLRESRRDLLTLARNATVLDIGCGDGSLAFFFESLGCRVTAVDNPGTNFNRTLGFKALGAALESSVEFLVRDLDKAFDVEARTFGLAFCLGVLYHLKNPFGFLETLSECARYCVLSTRIAQVTVRGTPIASEPLAYLVSPTETNNDRTNYWIFSEAGLRRILDRTGWEVCDYSVTGERNASDPARPDRDQRAFCMLRSKHPGPWLNIELDGGWNQMESGSWRWTQRIFAVRVQCASPVSKLRFRFNLAQPVFEVIGPIRLRAVANGVELPAQVYASPGEHTYQATIPLAEGVISIRFELDQAMTAPDGREIGLQVVFWNYDSATPRLLFPIVFT